MFSNFAESESEDDESGSSDRSRSPEPEVEAVPSAVADVEDHFQQVSYCPYLN